MSFEVVCVFFTNYVNILQELWKGFCKMGKISHGNCTEIHAQIVAYWTRRRRFGGLEEALVTVSRSQLRAFADNFPTIHFLIIICIIISPYFLIPLY